jgi:hypothetical protein
MRKTLAAVFMVLLAGCSNLPPPPPSSSPCAQSETSYECQVERYNNVNQ